MNTLSDKLSIWIKEQVKNAGAKGCVFGLSGGIDSAVVGVLCKQIFPENVLGLLMPCFSNDEDIKHAQLLASKFAIPTRLIDLRFAYDQLYVQLEGKPFEGEKNNLAAANIKPRLRMLSLYYHANKNNYLVVGTGNKSEAVMGYCTKYGDGGVDILPLAALLKSQVRELAQELGVPEVIIEKPPSAGLWLGQTDEEEMGIRYAELDKIIVGLEKGDLTGLDECQVKKVQQKMTSCAHKFNLLPIFQP
ncbi:NAD(+) synthase [candidate division WOR-1 bacterium RIFOXYB2_FULL_42_35]|uniref:NH(3)-dependent NAD(+) synthetase n=1 Tax=candidate division WOR-1 bacterium RIFOXYC2_FULL_41_25 TaxID=1802586 RepID=A0A1F4TNW8_UNCSA|nr:MAG: NAD(+) synthase [candidate division WOR-1 bacterium RIFOXYA2_FULL_41_14]OGC24818.1 MAG: NAD(+) synthase [candidate division WOR-1 bacterium RIFOXYB2_FULL_42_35]OGC34378.1 MAG: NAD(+) synthase [candidate division WOR-1 bacterium RIFOXYC2_FULL_41_25]